MAGTYTCSGCGALCSKLVFHNCPHIIAALDEENQKQAQQTEMARQAGALPSNPKQAYGDKKVPLHLIPSSGLIHEAMAFKEGARKYGPYNWRDKAVEAETYIGAALRHLYAYQDGEEIDPECGAHHLGLARACLGIILDASETGNLIDNRPVKGRAGELIREKTVG